MKALLLLPFIKFWLSEVPSKPQLPHFPPEIWAEIMSYVPITNEFCQQALSKYDLPFTQKHIDEFVKQFYEINQKILLKGKKSEISPMIACPDHVQQLIKAMKFGNSWSDGNKKKLCKAITKVRYACYSKLIKSNPDSFSFCDPRDPRDFREDYFIRREETNRRLYVMRTMYEDIDKGREKLFLIAMQYVSHATIKSLSWVNSLPLMYDWKTDALSFKPGTKPEEIRRGFDEYWEDPK